MSRVQGKIFLHEIRYKIIYGRGVRVKRSIFRIISLILLAAVASAVFTGCQKGEVEVPHGMKIASRDIDAYYFFVPERWTVQDSDGITMALYSSNDPSSVSVAAWELSHTDDTVDTWWEANIKDLSLVFNSFELVSEENATVDGMYAKSYVYTASIGESKYKFMQTACVKNTVVYLMTYTSLEEAFDSHLEDINSMISAWKFK